MTKYERLEFLKMIKKDIYVSSLDSTLIDDAKYCALCSIILDEEKKIEEGEKK